MTKRNVDLLLYTVMGLLLLHLGSCAAIRANRVLKNREAGAPASIPSGEVFNERAGGIYVPCSDADNELFDSIKAGNLEALQKMIELHGTEFYCSDRGGQSLDAAVIFTENYELIAYYLSQHPETYTRDLFFYYFLDTDSVYASHPEKLNLFKLTIKMGARNPQSAYDLDVELVKTAIKHGYDLTVMDSGSNSELHLLAAAYPMKTRRDYKTVCEKIDFYQSQGLRIRQQNNEGKTAIDLAENKRLKRYLKRKARKEQ